MNDGSQCSIPSYLDFDLEIGPGSGRDFPVAARAAAGEAREMMHFPFDELALESRLKDLQIALFRSGDTRRKVLSKEERAVQAFGQALFDALIVGEVRSVYHLAQREAVRQGKGLRLRLRIQPAELAALPWEFLFDPRAAEYVCLSVSTPIVRYIELAQPVQPLTIVPPLRILGMIANPASLEPLDVAREQDRVARAVKGLVDRGLVELTWLAGQTWRDLQRAMRGGPWHIFHFIGHGGFDPTADEGLVALADDAGRPHYLQATQLGRLLADHRSLRLVLLNACEGARGSDRDIFSSTAAILVRRGLPAVIAMQYEITDRAAVEFAQMFYEALADDWPVDASVAEARKAISLAPASSFEWGAPALFVGCRENTLFLLSAHKNLFAKNAAEPGDLPVAHIPCDQPMRKDWDQIIEVAEHAWKQSPLDLQVRAQLVEAYKDRAATRHQRGEYDKAITDYTRALELDPSAADLYFARSASHCKNHRYEQAVADLTKAIGISPSNARHYHARGEISHEQRVRLRRGSFDSAIADYSRAIELDSQNAQYYLDRGVAYHNQRHYTGLGDYNKAINDYDRAIELDSFNHVSFYYRGISFHAKGNHKQAIEDYTRAIELCQGGAEYYRARAVSHLEAGEYETALEDYTRAIELDPGVAQYYFERSIVRKRKGDRNGERLDLQRAADLGHDRAKQKTAAL